MNGRAPVTVQRRVSAAEVPAANTLRRWARNAMEDAPGELTIRIVAEDESAELNHQYRGRGHPTNVLSFAYGNDFPGTEAHASHVLGDLVICKAVVLREAREQGVAPGAHWAHMIVHGVLHLRGMDHENDDDAERMETRERVILARLGFADPYRVEHAACAETGRE